MFAAFDQSGDYLWWECWRSFGRVPPPVSRQPAHLHQGHPPERSPQLSLGLGQPRRGSQTGYAAGQAGRLQRRQRHRDGGLSAWQTPAGDYWPRVAGNSQEKASETFDPCFKTQSLLTRAVISNQCALRDHQVCRQKRSNFTLIGSQKKENIVSLRQYSESSFIWTASHTNWETGDFYEEIHKRGYVWELF